MLFIDQSIAKIRAYAREVVPSRRRLARLAGLAESTIRKIDAPDWSPEADTLRALEAIVPEDFGRRFPEEAAAPSGEAAE